MPSSAQAPGRDFVLLIGQPEQNHRRHAQRMHLLRLFHRFVHRQIEHARHRAHCLAHAFSGAHEHRVDERIRREAGLTYQVAQSPQCGAGGEVGSREMPWQVTRAKGSLLPSHLDSRTSLRRCNESNLHAPIRSSESQFDSHRMGSDESVSASPLVCRSGRNHSGLRRRVAVRSPRPGPHRIRRFRRPGPHACSCGHHAGQRLPPP